MQDNIRVYANSSLPKNYTDYLTYLTGVDYKDTLTLFDICLKTIFLNRLNEHLKFFILNNKFGSLGETLIRYKFDFLFISSNMYDYYTIPDEFKLKFKQINWKNKILKINFNPNCIFDLHTYFNSENDIQKFIDFLNNNNNPVYCGLIFFNNNLNVSSIIKYFESNNYFYQIDFINLIKSKYKDKLSLYSLDNLFIFSYLNSEEI